MPTIPTTHFKPLLKIIVYQSGLDYINTRLLYTAGQNCFLLVKNKSRLGYDYDFRLIVSVSGITVA